MSDRALFFKLEVPVFYDETIKDINIIFDPDAIDTEGRLLGKQYLEIEVRLLDENNRLVDLQTINNIVVCPGESSPRHAFNFSENPNIQRDIGFVLIATIEPVRSSAKFSVPIYFGTGYLLIEQDMFAIFGPGVRLHF